MCVLYVLSADKHTIQCTVSTYCIKPLSLLVSNVYDLVDFSWLFSRLIRCPQSNKTFSPALSRSLLTEKGQSQGSLIRAPLWSPLQFRRNVFFFLSFSFFEVGFKDNLSYSPHSYCHLKLSCVKFWGKLHKNDDF